MRPFRSIRPFRWDRPAGRKAARSATAAITARDSTRTGESHTRTGEQCTGAASAAIAARSGDSRMVGGRITALPTLSASATDDRKRVGEDNINIRSGYRDARAAIPAVAAGTAKCVTDRQFPPVAVAVASPPVPPAPPAPPMLPAFRVNEPVCRMPAPPLPPLPPAPPVAWAVANAFPPLTVTVV